MLAVAHCMEHLVAHKMLPCSPFHDTLSRVHSAPWREDPGIRTRDGEHCSRAAWHPGVQLLLLHPSHHTFPLPKSLHGFDLGAPFPGFGEGLEMSGTYLRQNPPALHWSFLPGSQPSQSPLLYAIPKGHVLVHGPLGAGCCSLLPNCQSPC